MSKKMALSDESLDNVSGGTLTFEGEAVTGYSVNEKGITITTASGDTFGAHDAETLAKIQDNPKAIAALEATIGGLMGSSTEFSMEELDKLL